MNLASEADESATTEMATIKADDFYRPTKFLLSFLFFIFNDLFFKEPQYIVVFLVDFQLDAMTEPQLVNHRSLLEVSIRSTSLCSVAFLEVSNSE